MIENDTRGWILTALSAVACMLGAALICLDLIVRRIPGQRHFRIEESNTFLSSSLSLSFGVMLFSALYKMLPSAKKSLHDGGLSDKTASWLLIVLFLGGALGIQVLSNIMHRYLPSHVVDCDHTHDDDQGSEMESHDEDDSAGHQPNGKLVPAPESADEPQLSVIESHLSRPATSDTEPELTLKPKWSNKLGIATKLCDETGRCYGYSDPCGLQCFKNRSSRSSVSNAFIHVRPTLQRQAITTESTPLLGRDVEAEPALSSPQNFHTPAMPGHPPLLNGHPRRTSHPHSLVSTHSDGLSEHKPHHHHVPTNAFLSIGLQTSLAIALHKLPEGFITYATNHANPRLGFAVFLSLFIHNITEGFALALPLYLALQSRPKAMLWSALLGGASQPLGAGIAALWFHLAGNSSLQPGERVYGGMFALVAGIMTSVALQLVGESMELTHNRQLCMVFAFIGMGILGVSSALTA